MATQPIIPTNNRTGIQVLANFDLGKHTVEIVADNSITLIDYATSQEVSKFTTIETSLDSDEVYRLMLVLHILFVWHPYAESAIPLCIPIRQGDMRMVHFYSENRIDHAEQAYNVDGGW